MMRYPAAETAEKHARALQSASRLFRERGFSGASISEIMTATGLTHGSFYNHFASKEDLLAEAFAHASHQSMAALEKFTRSEEGKQAMIRDYLSPEHRDDQGNGCIMAALATDFKTQPKTRAVVTHHVRSLVEKFGEKFPWSSRRNKRKQAINALATMVGALILARVVDDPELSNEILGSSHRDVYALDRNAGESLVESFPQELRSKGVLKERNGSGQIGDGDTDMIDVPSGNDSLLPKRQLE